MSQSQRIGNARKVDELTPEERRFCALRARGYSQTAAYREAYNRPRQNAHTASSHASNIARRPRVVAHLKALFCEAQKISLLSHAQFLDAVLSDWRAARQGGNWTAAASFERIAGQCIGTLSETIKLQEDRLTEEQLLERLGSSDPVLTERIQAIIAARRSFDA